MPGSVKAILVVLAVATTALWLVASAAADQTYPDPSGDAQGGPDITGVSVGPVGTSGLISFLVTTNDAVAANQAILILVDADGNASTGFQGAEYGMYAGAPVAATCGCGGATPTFSKFVVWNGSALVETHPASFSVGQPAANITQLLIDSVDIGTTSSIHFAAISMTIGPETDWDRAPNDGWYTYTPAAATRTVPLAVTSPKASGLHAGHPFTVTAHLSTAAPSATVKCVARIAGRAVHATGRYAASTAFCSGNLPAGSASKPTTPRARPATAAEAAPTPTRAAPRAVRPSFAESKSTERAGSLV